MKKTKSPGNSAKCFIALFICCAALFLPHKIFAQSGISCATAISTSAHGELILDSTTYTSTWYSLVADSVDVQIEIFNQDTGATAVSSIDMYSGTCAGLSLLSPTRVNGLHIVANYSGLTKGNTYYMKLSKTNTTKTYYTLAILNLNGLAASCSSCPLNPNNTSINTCQGVCNGGFEYTTGVTFCGQILRACPWDTTGIHFSSDTPDLFSTSVPNNIFGATVKVPNNAFGYQVPHHGNGYAGIITYSDYASGDREFLVQPLTVPMQAHKKYRVSYWVNLAGRSGYKASGIGVYLSNTNPNLLGYTSLKAQTPQIQGTLYNIAINDTTNWVLLTDTITPTTTINYIAIGSFQNDASDHHGAVGHTNWPNIMPLNVSPWQGIQHWAYYFVDDVSIVPYGSVVVTATPSPACNGVPVTFSATSSASNGYYTWSINPTNTYTCHHSPYCDTIISVLSYGSNMYTVTTTLPGYGSCTISDSIMPVWLAGPTNVNAGADQNICTGGTTTLTGTASGYYQTSSWANANGTGICSPCTTATVTVTTNSQYVFTATNTVSGCVMHDTVKVNVTPLPVTIVSPIGFATCDPNFIPFTTNPGTFSTWSWSTNAGTFSGTTNDTLLAKWNSNTSPGNVSVIVTGAGGCIGTASVTVPTCCLNYDENNVLMPDLVNDSASHIQTSHPGLFTFASSTYTATNKTFSINGVFIVDQNTQFIGCNVKLGTNAKIIIRPGKTLLLDRATSPVAITELHACSAMWDGIYVDGTNSSSYVKVINGTVIEDAKNAIVSTNGGNFILDGSGTGGTVKLNKNYIGVLVRPYQGNHPGVIRKTIISCDSPTQPGGTSGITSSGSNCIAPINGTSFAAIDIDSCSNIIIGDSASISYRNLFEREQFGIWTKNSNVKVWNNDFKYFTTVGITKTSPSNGVAIYARGNSALTRTLTVGRVGANKAHNLIRKSTYGVMVENAMNLNCEYNRLDSISRTAVYALDNQVGKSILINKDSILDFTGTGINCTNIKQSTVTVTNNFFNETSISNPTSFGVTGIYIANALNYTTCTVKIQSNTVKRIRNGIWILNVTRAQIMDNSITFYPAQTVSVAYPAIGIKMEAAHSALIRNNTIDNNNSAITSNSQLSTYYDKIFGIHVTNCFNDTVTKNTIKKCGSGLFLKGTEVPFLNGCNTFTTCYYGVNFGYSNASQISVNTTSQFRWINPTSGARTPTGDTWSGCFNDIYGKAYPAIGWYYNTLSSSPQPLNLSTFTHQTIKDSTTTITNQCTALLSPVATGTATELRTALLGGICKTPRAYDTLSGQYHYIDSVYAFRMLKDNPSWTSLGTGDDSYYSGWYTSVASTNIGKLAAIEDSIRNNKLAGAASLLAAISPTGTPESNRITVMGIYLNTWAKDSMNLDSIQSATLRTIAHGAPVSGGIAVYDARAMLFEEVHDSSSLRMASSYPPDGTINPGNIYPNPTTGKMMLNYQLSEGQTGTMQLYDLSGRIVHRYTLVGGSEIQQFDAEDIPGGLYFYSVFVNGNIIMSNKVIIIKQ
jgi:hypothetical protein